MDPAMEIELKALSRQKPMNDIIDQGDSAVQQFYKGVTIFITGGSGFIGKQLIEKLFRACAIEKMYLLIRPKRKTPIHERLPRILNDPVFNLLYTKKPKFSDRIVPIEGDISKTRMGMNDKQWRQVTEEVNVIFHVAATTNFNAPLHEAAFTNVLGTREILALAKESSKCKSFVYVSTSYTHATKDRVGKEFLEQFYPCALSPDTLIQLVENIDKDRLNGITQELINPWPNTYTFTKAIAEELIRTSAGDLPICIVRPTIVGPAYCEPAPGWLDASTIFGPSGLFLGIGFGVLHLVMADEKVRLPLTPVDSANNITIVAPWDAAERQRNGDAHIPIYNATDKNACSTFGLIQKVLHSSRNQVCSPKAVWHCFGTITKSEILFRIYVFFLLHIPAYLLDQVFNILGKRPANIKSFLKLSKKIEEIFFVYKHFTFNEWDFNNDNVTAMVSRMSDSDQMIFNCDLPALDMEEYFLIWSIGLRKYVVKDGLRGTRAAVKWQYVYATIDYVFLIVITYFFWQLFVFIAF